MESARERKRESACVHLCVRECACVCACVRVRGKDQSLFFSSDAPLSFCELDQKPNQLIGKR